MRPPSDIRHRCSRVLIDEIPKYSHNAEPAQCKMGNGGSRSRRSKCGSQVLSESAEFQSELESDIRQIVMIVLIRIHEPAKEECEIVGILFVFE